MFMSSCKVTTVNKTFSTSHTWIVREAKQQHDEVCVWGGGGGGGGGGNDMQVVA